MARIDYTLASFRTHLTILQEQGKDAGEVGKSSHCPLAVWYTAQGVKNVSVSARRLLYDNEYRVSTSVVLPDWQRKFVAEIDLDLSSQSLVSAARALEVVDTITWAEGKG